MGRAAELGNDWIIERADQLSALERATKELETERAQLWAIIESAGDGIVRLDREGRIVSIHPAAVEMVGWTAEELLGRPHHAVFHHTHIDGTPYPWDECLVKATLEDGTVYRVSNEVFWRKDGTGFPVEYTSTPILDGDDLRGAVLVFRDITERVETQEELRRLNEQVRHHAEVLEQQVQRRTAALRASQARFQAVFEDSAIGIALVNSKGRIIDINPALQEMLGYSKDELEGVELGRLTHPDNVKDDAHLYEELMAGERAFYRIEGRYLRKDGEPIHVNLIVSMVRPVENRPRFAIALVEDVTEQKRTQAALIEAEKLALTGRLAASLAHEINNPMQSVIGYLSLVEEMLPESADAHEYVEIALEELERAAGIVARMRDLGRPSEPGERELVDVNVLVERVLLLTQKRCQNRQIEVQWEAAEDLPLLVLVPDRIQQVFLNLVLNAVDAMAADIPKLDRRRLRVYTAHAQESQEVQIVFADNGVGIPPDEQASLFEPFHTTKEAGLGLGLYISQSIVQDHGGHISVESQKGIGTTLTVWLPSQGTPD
jgi:two-component system NtrC family sensor kinase